LLITPDFSPDFSLSSIFIFIFRHFRFIFDFSPLLLSLSYSPLAAIFDMFDAGISPLSRFRHYFHY